MRAHTKALGILYRAVPVEIITHPSREHGLAISVLRTEYFFLFFF